MAQFEVLLCQEGEEPAPFEEIRARSLQAAVRMASKKIRKGTWLPELPGGTHVTINVRSVATPKRLFATKIVTRHDTPPLKLSEFSIWPNH